MLVPFSFKKELQLIDKDYFCVWDDRRHRWIIRWWIKGHTKADLRSYEDFCRKSIVVMIVAKYNHLGKDIDYHPLDQRVLYALKRRKYMSEQPISKILKEVDEANEKLNQKALQEMEAVAKEVSAITYDTVNKVWSK